MPIGGFLDSFPSLLFIGAHLLFLAIGVWTWRNVSGTGARLAWSVWLYVASQVVFLVFFAGGITMKMAVLVEQTCMVVLMLALATKRSAAPER
jgi:hypothetical protein